jgi:hypothetical protein
MHELAELVGGAMEPSSEPLGNSWHLLVNGLLARRLGFRPGTRIAYQAAEGKLVWRALLPAPTSAMLPIAPQRDPVSTG